MLTGADRIELPEDVRLADRELFDAVRDSMLPVNPVAAFVLERAGESIDAIADQLVAAYGIEPERARADVASFAGRLNALLLLNVRMRRRRVRWLWLALRLAPLRALPPAQARRVALTGGRLRRVGRHLAPRAAAVAFAVAAVLVATGLLPAAEAAALGGAAGAGIVAHEAAHVAALGARPAALVLHGWAIYVLHPPLRGARRSLVALAGPLAPTLAGALLIALAAATATATAALAGMLLTAHALGATVVGRDGRTACGL